MSGISSEQQPPNADPKNQQVEPSTTMPPFQLPPNLKFGPFSVTPQVFHLSRSRLSFGLVNLKPLLPGHVLICPVRCVPRLSQLSSAETADLFQTVQRVSRTLERLYSASAFNVAVQDGVDAGQSVPHVHVHIIPRRRGDYDHKGGGDQIYNAMDGEEGDVGKAFLEMQRRRDELAQQRTEIANGPDSDRQPRSIEEMMKEAEWLREEMEKDRVDGDEDS
ncbi:Dinucleoside triphosphate hydrolase [Exophiala dermatitidis]|nr:Dinucleoside triphosphate hydrolase [Exophiala dermatitidis]KAJ4523139.1 Dinucleoside triphosphate hydrolase [Exophiala dermatitidis]KAJ4526467.1 Dinucleoside triphosphate hydrolase [Exophiala dermatitidis]KAJ4532287.1 Dinucleoside triphosphate hydrolase [Exophiala dermatitidis]KAJ4546324.1 Dinucleoside triphosphate hydrolase [Exophiala dermatitidis]